MYEYVICRRNWEYGDVCCIIGKAAYGEVVIDCARSLPIDLFCVSFALCAAVSGSVC